MIHNHLRHSTRRAFVTMIAGGCAAYPSLRETGSRQTPTSIDTKVYLSHPARFTTRIPTTWHPDDTLRYDYASRDGFISSRNLNDLYTNITSLDQASEIAASAWRFEVGARVSALRWQGLDARTISSSSDPSAPISLVFVHPTVLANGHPVYAELTTSNRYFESIIGAVSFDPMLVTVDLYVNTAADFLETHSIMRDRIPWTDVRTEALASFSGYADTNRLWLAAGALQTLIAAIVSAGGDGHNALWTPDMVNSLGGLQVTAEPTGQTLGQGMGYLNVPGFSGDDDAGRPYAHAIRSLLVEHAPTATVGWIVDLRSNPGGNMYPALWGLLPLLRHEPLLTLLSSNGTTSQVAQTANHLLALGGDEFPPFVPSTPLEWQAVETSRRKIAILVDSTTASAGEAIMLALNAGTCSTTVGQATAGMLTAPSALDLFDGSRLMVSTWWVGSHNGGIYQGHFTPDQEVARTGDSPPSPADEVAGAGIRWLLGDEES